MPNGFESILGEVIPDVGVPSPAVGMSLPDWGPEVWETMRSAVQPLGGLTLNAWSPAAAVDQATPSGVLDWLNRMAAQWERPVRMGVTLLGGLTSGAMALQSARQQRMLERAQRAGLEMMRQQQAVAGPPQAAAAQLVPAGAAALTGGALPPGLEAQIDLWKRQQLAQLMDLAARLGITDSTALAQMRAELDARAEVLRTQLAEALMQRGLAAAQTAAAALGGAAGTARGLETSITGQLASTDELLRRAQAELSSYIGQA
jgi:hypothetical protein